MDQQFVRIRLLLSTTNSAPTGIVGGKISELTTIVQRRPGVWLRNDRQESGDERSAYLLDGRRVTIGDLIDAGLLTPGTGLQFRRPRAGQTHRAVVTQAGTISLEEGQEFRSPSRAAVVVADVSAIDGWHAWTVIPSGRSLDSLRQDLLGQGAAGAAGKPESPLSE